MKMRARCVALLMLTMAAWLGIAMEADGTADSQKQTATTYAHSLEGFQQQYERMVEAFRKKHASEAAERVQEFRLPDAASWLAQNFDAANQQELAARYEAAFRTFAEALNDTYSDAPEFKHFKLRVEARPAPKTSKPTLFTAKQEILLEWFSTSVAGDNISGITWMNTFVYVDGAFRFMGPELYSFWQWDKPPTQPGWIVHAAKLVYSVPPHYPLGAKASGIQGVVQLRGIVRKDGTVSIIRVLSGDPALVDAAIEAVRQWRYQPTRIGRMPVEVETTFDVTFALGRQ